MFTELKIKYFDNNLIKTHELIYKFYNYKSINNKTINYVFTRLI